ncbi:MAG: glycosyl transferase family 2 [Acidobacteria bacterium]|nr:MAG: glycosyl transferase family 2 [Acidobacteriota bacterium]
MPSWETASLASSRAHASQAAPALDISVGISVIIVNFNTRELLTNCLESLQRHAGAATEIIVIDNHSSDGSAEAVRTQFRQAMLVENSQNLGFAKANNQGIRKARGKYFLLLNSDTVIGPGALDVMADFLDTHPEAAGVTCRLLNADGSIQASVSHRPGPLLLLLRLSGLAGMFQTDGRRRWLRRYLGWLLGRTLRVYLDPYAASGRPLEVENISAACLMLRREAVEQVGLLDESFFMYFEDMEYCIRLHQGGWKLYYLPKGEVIHLVGQSSAGRMRDYSVHSYQGLFYLYRRHYSAMSRLIVRIVVVVASSLRWMWNLVASLVSRSPLRQRNRRELQRVIRLCFQYRGQD